MMGFPIYGPSYIYGDNMSVIYNNQRPDSNLMKNSNSMCYHEMRESVAMGESSKNHILTNDNPMGLMAKVLAGQNR